MILLLGATGYIGQAFAAELTRRALKWRPVSRKDVNYTSFPVLLDLLRGIRPEFLINAAGFTGRPNVDACETARAETTLGNAMLPLTIAHACAVADVPWGHVSSGCIYHGAKVLQDEEWRIVTDLSGPGIERRFRDHPEEFRGFDEADQPNFSFRVPPCSFYSGTKALGEESIAGIGAHYVWRLRIPFDELDNGRNYLSKLLNYSRIYQNINSLSHRADYAKACLDLWEKRAPFGTYNVTNPGAVSTRQVVERIQAVLHPARVFEFWENDAEFYRQGAATPRSNCILDVSRLREAGVTMRPVEEALDHALANWKCGGAAGSAAGTHYPAQVIPAVPRSNQLPG